MSTTTRPPEVRASSPYVGPRPFTREDREGFFGRDAEVDRLVSEVISSPTLVIYSVSGAGKTSLLAAGLRPALRDQGFETLPTVRFAARAELPDVRNVFTHMTLRSLTQSDSQEPDPRWLADPDATLADALMSIPPGQDADGFPQARALVFDQFEELFTLHDERWPDRKAFMAQVWEALDSEPELRVVFALREEYLGQFGEHAGGLPRTRFHLERLRHDAAMRAVTGPLEGTGRTFGEGVAERLVKDLQGRYDGPHGQTVWGEFVEPLHLQVVCRQLWSRLDHDAAVITRDHLAVYGNVDEALTSYYDDAVAAAAAAAHMPEWKVRRGLEKLFVTSSGTRAIVFEREAETTLGTAAIAELGRLHLVRTEWRAGAAWLELAHDRLIAPIRNSDAGVLQAHRRVVFLRTVFLVVVVLALIGGAGLAWIVALSNRNSALQSSTASLQKTTAAQKTTNRVLRSTVAVTNQQKKLIRTTIRVASDWVNAFNAGDDARAASYMLPVVRLSTSVTDQSTTKPIGKRLERTVNYLRHNPCSLGPAPQQMGSNEGSAAFLVDPVGQRPHHRGCQVGPPWLLTITVKHGRVTGLDSRSLAAALAGTTTTTTSATTTGTPPTEPTGLGGPPPVPPPSPSPSSGPAATTPTRTGPAGTGGPPAAGGGAPGSSTETSSASTTSTPTATSQTSTGVNPTTGTATATAPTATPPPTVSTFTIVTTTTPAGG